jgi:hypothetical protein
LFHPPKAGSWFVDVLLLFSIIVPSIIVPSIIVPSIIVPSIIVPSIIVPSIIVPPALRRARGSLAICRHFLLLFRPPEGGLQPSPVINCGFYYYLSCGGLFNWLCCWLLSSVGAAHR